MASSFDPFDAVDVLNIPEFKSEDEIQWQGFHFSKELKSEIFSIPHVDHKALQDLQPSTFTFEVENVPIPSLEASSASSYTTAEDDLYRNIEQPDKDSEPWENVWTLPEVKDSSRRSKLTSWDHFTNGQHIEPGTAYLSEAGASTFDAIIASLQDPKQTVPLVFTDRFLHALYELGLGRSSVLFQWSEEQHRFAQNTDDFTVSGCTSGLIQNTIESTAVSGTMMRKLSEARSYYRLNTIGETPCVLAFHSALSSCPIAVQQYMNSQRYDIKTVLHFQQVYSNVVPLLELLDYVATLLEHSNSDHALLATLLGNATSLSLRYPHFGPVLSHLISSMASPALDELSRDVGLNPRHCLSVEQRHTDEARRLSAVLPTEILQTVQQAAHTLQLLQGDISTGLSALLLSRQKIKFDLAFTWASVLRIQTEADSYENNVKSNLLSEHFGRGPVAQSLSAATDPAPWADVLADSADAFRLLDLEKWLPVLNVPDPASTLVLDCLNQATSGTELALSYDEVIAQSVSPLLFAQHRLLSYSVFELLFTEHGLLSHLTLQHQIQLLGDGMFGARLDTALFDSEQSSGEGRRRTGATTGLRLQTRDSWPPASSELRLVLMGVLSESMSVSGAKAFVDTVSFAIRDLSEEEVERCRDADSIHALDFLKLQYRPPSPVLEAVISTDSLDKYDRIFQHLLRVLRLKNVAQGLLREVSSRRAPVHDRADHKFRIEVQSFVLTIADYCQNVAVHGAWNSFANTIHNIGRKLEARDYDGVLSLGQSLENLRRKHEHTLDSILRALFLKRKQKQALEVLEDVFGVILRYAAAARKISTDEETMQRYHVEFKGLVRRFIGLLQDMAQNANMNDSHGDGDSLFEALLVRLDFSGHWSRADDRYNNA